jgi:hypothetical protein
VDRFGGSEICVYFLTITHGSEILINREKFAAGGVLRLCSVGVSKACVMGLANGHAFHKVELSALMAPLTATDPHLLNTT